MVRSEIIAKIKMIKDRALGYFSLWVYLLIILQYFKVEISNIMVLVFFLLCIVATVVDWIFVFPEEQRITWERNPAYNKLKEKEGRTW